VWCASGGTYIRTGQPQLATPPLPSPPSITTHHPQPIAAPLSFPFPFIQTDRRLSVLWASVCLSVWFLFPFIQMACGCPVCFRTSLLSYRWPVWLTRASHSFGSACLHRQVIPPGVRAFRVQLDGCPVCFRTSLLSSRWPVAVCFSFRPSVWCGRCFLLFVSSFCIVLLSVEERSRTEPNPTW